MKLIHFILLLSISVLISSCSGSANKDKKENAKVYLRQQVSGSGVPNENNAKEESNSAIIVLTDQNFRSEISSGVVLVDFWAVWCRPCRIQGPIIEELATEMKDKIKVGKMDVDENPVTSRQFGIESIPTIIIFKDGKEIKTFVGLSDKSTLMAEINKLL